MRLSAQVTQSGTVLESVGFKLKRKRDVQRAVGKVVNRFRKGGGQLFAEDTTIAVVKKGVEGKTKGKSQAKAKPSEPKSTPVISN